MGIGKDGLMLASMPSSSSDWVAECILKAAPELVYAREFFSPTCNWRYSAELSEVLGDTLHSTTPNLCRQVPDFDFERLLNATWRREPYTFTKECYLPFQLEQFAVTFSIIVLLRRFEDTFPPHRHRVMRWYEHFHAALCLHRRLDQWTLARSHTPMARAAIGHYWFSRRLHEAALDIGAPILWHHDLADRDGELIRHYAGDGFQVDVEAFARAVVESRRPVERPGGEYQEQWADASRLHRELVARYGAVDMD